MKIAFLFSGQLRQINQYLFKKSLTNLTKNIDYSIYSFCWQELGESLNHKKKVSEITKIKNINNYIENLFHEFNLQNYSTESFSHFKNNLSSEYKKILFSKRYHYGTINALPQIYTLYRCYKLLIQDKYDLVFRCRYDSLFIHPINLYDLKNITLSKNIYNINFGRAYYPYRIYDIFFGGSNETMKFLNNIWDEIPSIIQDKFNNGLDNRDACRILYISAKNNNINFKSLPTRICDINRNDSYFYEKYLINSHLLSIKPNRASITSIRYIYNWLSNRGLFNFRLLYYILETILYFPFSYIKRLKYISIYIKNSQSPY